MKINTDPKKIKEVLTRGVEEIIEKESLLKKLSSGKKLRIKHGVDPTGPKIHIGRAIQLWKLKELQDLGHQIVLIIGDFTAQIGDASDKQAMRRPLSEREVGENMKNYLKQIGKVLDANKIELRRNSEWLNNLKIKKLISLSMKFSAQQMIQRRNFKERWEKGKPIGLHELNYPLFQGYDSVMVKADLEIGGADQLFNLKAGREIQKNCGQKPQDIMILKMLFGLDGRKMSTTWGNTINITDPPQEMYGKIMSMKDELMEDYFELCTKVPFQELRRIKKSLKEKNINPRDLKTRLAREIIILYYNKKAAAAAEKEFERIFKEKKTPEKIPQIKVKEKNLNILDFLVKIKLASSKSEAKRLVLQKGVKIDGKTQEDWRKIVKTKKGQIIKVGKRKFLEII